MRNWFSTGSKFDYSESRLLNWTTTQWSKMSGLWPPDVGRKCLAVEWGLSLGLESLSPSGCAGLLWHWRVICECDGAHMFSKAICWCHLLTLEKNDYSCVKVHSVTFTSWKRLLAAKPRASQYVPGGATCCWVKEGPSLADKMYIHLYKAINILFDGLCSWYTDFLAMTSLKEKHPR